MTVTQMTILVIVFLILAAGVWVLALQFRKGWRDLYESYREERHWRRSYPSERYGLPISDIISSAEDESNVRLTWAARQMLTLPVIESLERGDDLSWGEVNDSVRSIVRTIAEEPSPGDERTRERSSKSIIRGFHRRYCNIPPFCSRREEERG